MEFDIFCDKVKRHVEEHYGASKTVTLKSVIKNTIRKTNRNNGTRIEPGMYGYQREICSMQRTI